MIAYEHVKNIKLNPDILERNKINLRDDYLTEIKNLNLKIQLPEEGFMGFCFGLGSEIVSFNEFVSALHMVKTLSQLVHERKRQNIRTTPKI